MISFMLRLFYPRRKRHRCPLDRRLDEAHREISLSNILRFNLEFQGTIKDVHAAVVNDDKETFQKRTADPVPNQIFISKDQNGLNPLHKVRAPEDDHSGLLRNL